MTGHDAAVVGEEFVFDEARFARCHAATVEETPDGLVAAWFGGRHEGHCDVGIWCARQVAGRWLQPAEVARGEAPGGKRLPCWNPVLFSWRPHGPLLLFYKCGPRPSEWWGLVMSSRDGGVSWAPPRRLPRGIFGPIKNKPIEHRGVLLCPASSEDDGWRVHIERSGDRGSTWERTEPINDGYRFAAIQPSFLVHDRGRLQILCRSKRKRIVQSWSDDGGLTWSPMTVTELPNPNSGTDALTLADGRHLLVYNPATAGRTPLHVAVSEDGERWASALELENGRGEYSYPAVIQGRDGLVHITYTWKRLFIKHVVLDPRRLGR